MSEHNNVTVFVYEVIGTYKTSIICGTSCVIGSLLFALKLPQMRKKVRLIYIKMGIISELE